MATDGVVVTHATEVTPNIGDLFAGKCFFIAMRVPMRTSFLDRIRANGGRIVRLEMQADYIIADHVRNDCPPTSLSYTFIETALRDGALPDPNNHRAGPAPGAVRAVGSTQVAPRATRTAFTPQDDRDLWLWVQNYRSMGAHGIKGHEIYKQLEAINPRHTFQSWRDRYVKRLMLNPPPGVEQQAGAGAPSTQPALPQPPQQGMDGTVEEEAQAEEEVEDVEYSADVMFLLDNIDDILNIPVEDLDAVWGSLADEEASSHLTAEQWKRIYEEEALPAYTAYQAKQEKKKRAQASTTKRRARVATPEPPEEGAEPSTPELVAMRAKAARDSQVSPSASNQKRKRQAATPRGSTYGRKRAKADDFQVLANEQLAEGEHGASSNAHTPALAGARKTSQEATKVGEENGIDNGINENEPALPGEEPLPTSELNRAAMAQLIAEANPTNSPGEGADTDVGALRTDVEVVEPLPVPKQASASPVEAPGTEQAGAISPSNNESQVEANAQTENAPQNGLQLTEENLANQQAAHGEKVTRASNLRENDENLSNYAEYLQKLVSGHTAKLKSQLSKEDELNADELESDRELSPAPETQVAANVTPSGGGVANDQTQAVGNGPTGLDANSNDDVEIDLTLAEPEGGFTFSSQEEANAEGLPSQQPWEPKELPQLGQINGAIALSSDDQEMEEAPAKAVHAALNTQDIYATGAQQPDFSFPLPPDSQVEQPEPETSADTVMKPTLVKKATPRRTASTRKRTTSATPRKAVKPPTRQEPSALEDGSETIPSFLARLTVKGCSPALLENAIYRTSAQLPAAELVAMSEKLGLPVPDNVPEIWTADEDAQVGTTDATVFKALCERKGWEEYDFRLNFLQDWRAGVGR